MAVEPGLVTRWYCRTQFFLRLECFMFLLVHPNKGRWFGSGNWLQRLQLGLHNAQSLTVFGADEMHFHSSILAAVLCPASFLLLQSKR